MLAELAEADGDAVYKASLVRLLRGCDDDAQVAGRCCELLDDPSPLVRSSAASALGDHLTPEALKALLAATARSVAVGADPRRDVAGRRCRPSRSHDRRDRENLEQANRGVHARP